MNRVIIYVAPKGNSKVQLAGALPERYTPFTPGEEQNVLRLPVVRIKQGLILSYWATLSGRRVDKVSRLPGWQEADTDRAPNSLRLDYTCAPTLIYNQKHSSAQQKAGVY